MKTFETYRYLGRNGIITSRVLLDGISHIAMYELKADEGKILTDGSKLLYTAVIYAEDLSKWHEIDDIAAKDSK